MITLQILVVLITIIGWWYRLTKHKNTQSTHNLPSLLFVIIVGGSMASAAILVYNIITYCP